MKTWYVIPTLLSIACVSMTAQAAVTATVNRTVIASGETIQLKIQRDGSADGQPDISPLRKDFDILGSSSGSNVQIINGKMSSQTQITILLSPKHDGKILIPPLHWGGEQSASIELSVGGSGAAPQQKNGQTDNDNDHVYLTTTLDKIQPYVQAAVVLTLRLYADQGLHQAALDFPASSDVLVKQLGKDVQLSEVRNGRNFQIVERKYLLFPQRSGKLNLNGPVLDAQIADRTSHDPFDSIFRQMPFGGMLNSTRPIRVRAKPIELNVLPRPASVAGTTWLPAQKVTLEETPLQNKSILHVGEPITRHLKITALGLTGAQLPDPNTLINMPDGIKAYPDQAILTDNPQGNSVLGSREQNIALIANRPGHYDLPAVRLNWWDTVNNEKRELTLPALSLDILPGTAGSNTTNLPGANTEPTILLNQAAPGNTLEQTRKLSNHPAWMWLSLTLTLLWLGKVVAWWRSRQPVPQNKPQKKTHEKKPATLRESAEIKAIKRACNNNDPHAARQHLLAWASKARPETQALGLNELAARFDDARLIDALKQLDRACYTASAWNGQDLLQALPASLAPISQATKQLSLPSLYQ